MNTKQRWIGAAVAILSALVLAGCGSDELRRLDIWKDPGLYDLGGARWLWTPPNEMPASGTARYSGFWSGTHEAGTTTESLNGLMAARVDFSTHKGKLFLKDWDIVFREYGFSITGNDGNEIAGKGIAWSLSGHFEGSGATELSGYILDRSYGILDVGFSGYQ